MRLTSRGQSTLFGEPFGRGTARNMPSLKLLDMFRPLLSHAPLPLTESLSKRGMEPFLLHKATLDFLQDHLAIMDSIEKQSDEGDVNF